MTDGSVLYIARTVPGYRLSPLRRLNDRLNGRLVVYAGSPPAGSSLRSLGVPPPDELRVVPVRNVWLRGESIHFQSPLQPFRDHPRPTVVLMEESPRSVSLPWLLQRARRTGAGTVLWGHFSSNNRAFDPGNNLLDRIRVAYARQVDACACYTDGIAAALDTHLEPGHTFVARNTLDSDRLDALRMNLESEGRPSVRMRLGLQPDRPVLAFIGRLIPEKGLGLLAESFGAIRSRTPATLVVIGDGPERTRLETRLNEHGAKDVVFTGSLNRLEDSAPWLYASDLLLSPGYLGLSVNHAFAFGLPVVSIDSPAGARLHSPEVEYVEHGRNGLLVDPNPHDLAEAVHTVLTDRSRYGRLALEYWETHLTLDRMLDGLEAALRFAAERRGLRLP